MKEFKLTGGEFLLASLNKHKKKRKRKDTFI